MAEPANIMTRCDKLRCPIVVKAAKLELRQDVSFVLVQDK
jgi:hypothetical protein